MSRSNRPLPTIPVKHVLIRKTMNITKRLEAKLHAYIAYYTEGQGLDVKQAPTEADTLVALVENYLARDPGFNRYLRDKQQHIDKRKALASDTTSA